MDRSSKLMHCKSNLRICIPKTCFAWFSLLITDELKSSLYQNSGVLTDTNNTEWQESLKAKYFVLFLALILQHLFRYVGYLLRSLFADEASSFEVLKRDVRFSRRWEFKSWSSRLWLLHLQGEDGGSMILRNISILPHHYTPSEHTRPSLSVLLSISAFCEINR